MLRTVSDTIASPVSLEEAKQHLHVLHSDHDARIMSLVGTATLQAQAYVQRRFVTQKIEWVRNHWESVLRLPVAPVAINGVESIEYADWNTGAEETLPAERYVVRTRGPTVVIYPALGTVWPLLSPTASEPIIITFTAGTDPAAVPENVKSGIKIFVELLYDPPDDPAAMRDIARDLLLSEVW